jgi:hypothetical protein
MKVPNYIREFCKTISDQEPIIISLCPITGKPANECVTIVSEHIASHGGKQKFGWWIHVWKNVFVEAEFHSVWESPDSELVDLTPRVAR